MVVSAGDPDKLDGLGNGSGDTFSFSPMVIYENANMTVTHVVIATGVETPIPFGTGAAAFGLSMPVSFPDDPATGSVVYPEDQVTPMPTGEKIVMKPVLTLEQQLDLDTQGGYFADLQEIAHDKVIRIAKQQQEEIDRSVKLEISIAGVAVTLGLPVALRYLRWNAAADAIEAVANSTTTAAASDVNPLDISQTAPAPGIAADFSREDHVHELPVVGIAKGGTGQSTAALALAALQGAGLLLSNIFTGASQTLELSDDGATAGPSLLLNRISTTPAVLDNIGRLQFTGRSDTGVVRSYITLLGRIVDPTNGSENGRLRLQTILAGTTTDRLVLEAGVYTPNAVGGDPGADGINASEIQVDGVQLSATGLRGYIDGCTLVNNVTDIAKDMDIKAGVVRSDDNATMIDLSALTKKADEAWVVGTNQGGLSDAQLDGAQTVTFADNGGSPDTVTIDSGTWTVTPDNGDLLIVTGGTNAGSYPIAAGPSSTVLTVATGSFVADAASTSEIRVFKLNSTYHIHAIKRPDTGVTDIIIDSSATSPNLPTNYTKSRRIGSMTTDASANWTLFFQRGDEVLLSAGVRDFSDAGGTGENLRVLSVPLGIQVVAMLTMKWEDAPAARFLLLTSPDIPDLGSSPGATHSDMSSGAAITSMEIFKPIRTNTSGQVRYRADGAGGTIRSYLGGWIDSRGKDE